MILQRTKKSTATRGFTLVELVIVLAVASVLFTGLWRLMSSGNTQLRDQSAADQHKQLIAAAGKYLASPNGQAFLQGLGGNATAALAIPGGGGCGAAINCLNESFLPAGFINTTTNAYGQTYAIRVRTGAIIPPAAAPENYSYLVATVAGDTIPDVSGARIAGLIGGDGGFRYTDAVCGAPVAAANVCGSYSAWFLNPGLATTYAFAVGAGHIASRTFISAGASSSSPWLARVALAGADPDGNGVSEPNTIQTDIDLGGNTLFGNGAGTGGILRNLELITNLGNLLVSIPGPATGGAAENPVTLGRAAGCGPGHVYPDETGATTCDYTLQVNGGMSVTGFLGANRLWASQFFYNTTSDRALKEDIAPIEHALDKVAKLNGYSFLVKKEQKKKYGVIAQEVEDVFPYAVTEIGGGYKGVDYMGLIGPLVAAVKELKEENDKLKEDLAAIRSMLEEKRVGQMEKE